MRNRGSLSCFIIGEGSLPIHCGEALLERGHIIGGVISSDVSVNLWTEAKGIPHIDPTDDLVAILSQRPFDYLFSIVNEKILPESDMPGSRGHLLVDVFGVSHSRKELV